MGCDIHLIAQVKKKDKWEYIPQTPDALMKRDYNLFTFLAGVHDNIGIIGNLKPKGIPDDLEASQYRFLDSTDLLKEKYETQTEKMAVSKDGNRCLDVYDERFKIQCKSEEEAKTYKNYRIVCGEEPEFSAYDCTKFGFEEKEVPVKEFMPFDEFVEKFYTGEFNDEMKKYGIYGRWDVDFSCEDYHSASWLTLQELKDADKGKYYSDFLALPVYFYDAFVSNGGLFPKNMHTELPGADGVFSAITKNCECVIVHWLKTEEEKEKLSLTQGIRQMEEIAGKYGVEDNSIRIVFAFDN